MTDKQIIEQRQICLYQDTCLHLKEKTRVCEDCVHHKNYWSELLAKDQAEKIKKLEQECEELKKQYNCYACDTCKGKEDYINLKIHCENAIKSLHNKQTELDQLKAENKHLNDLLNQALKELEKTRETLTEIKEIAKNGCYDDCGMPLDELSIILQKISEVGND